MLGSPAGIIVRRMNGEYTPNMERREQLAPKRCIELIAARVRQRIDVLIAVRLPAFDGTISELRVVLDLLERAIRYIEAGEASTKGIPLGGAGTPARRSGVAHD